MARLVVDHAAQLVRRDIGQIEEMADAGRSSPPPAWLRWRGAARWRAQARSIRATASAISASLTISGGSSRTTLSPARDRQQLLGAQRVDQFAGRHQARRPISRPSPRTSAITAGWRSLISASRCLNSSACLRHVIEEARRQRRRRAPHCRPPSPADCRRRSSRGCRPSCPWPASAVASTAPIGKPPPSALASAMMSGVDAELLIGEQFAGAADAGLHLVEHQQQAVLVAQLAQRRRNAGGTTRTPPSPCTGSIRMAAVSGRSRA